VGDEVAAHVHRHGALALVELRVQEHALRRLFVLLVHEVPGFVRRMDFADVLELHAGLPRPGALAQQLGELARRQREADRESRRVADQRLAGPPQRVELVGREVLAAELRELVAAREQPAVVAAHTAPQRVVLGPREAQHLVDEAEVAAGQELEADLGVLEEPALGVERARPRTRSARKHHGGRRAEQVDAVLEHDAARLAPGQERLGVGQAGRLDLGAEHPVRADHTDRRVGGTPG
jgi:hypothetical protein